MSVSTAINMLDDALNFINTCNFKQHFPQCYCGGTFKRKTCENPDIICCNCFERIGKGNITNVCVSDVSKRCVFYKANGFYNNVCVDCFENLKTKILPLFNQEHRIETLLRIAIKTTKQRATEKKDNQMQLKLYACLMRRILYKIINNFDIRNKITKELHAELVAAHDEIYNSIISQIAKMIDEHELDLKEHESEPDQKTSLTLDLKEKIRMKWYVKVNNYNEDYFTSITTCPYIYACKSVKRIQCLLELYQEYCLKNDGKDEKTICDIFLCCLRSYKIPDMINDFIHIMDVHNTAADLKSLREYYLKMCENKDCKSEYTRFTIDNNTIEIKQDNNETIVILKYFRLLHSYFAHHNGIQISGDNQNNKSNAQKESEENSKTKTQYNKFQTIVQVSENDSNEFEAVEQIGKFSFGIKFYYWPSFRDHDKYIENAKYATLKEELLNNIYHSISIELFSNCVFSALQFILSEKARKMKAKERGLNNENCAVPVGLSLTKTHLIALMFYTNHTDLQFNFKKFGTRKLNSTDTDDMIKLRHIEIANWFRLLYESVMFFGKETTRYDSVKYHGVSVRLLCDELSPDFKAPISTTTSLRVASGFAEGGIIIALKPNSSREDMYFPVTWISTFPEEQEHLLVEATNLNIVDIVTYPDLKTNNEYIQAIRLFDEIFKAYYFICGFHEKQKTEQVLCKLIQPKIDRISDLFLEDEKKLFCSFLIENEYDSDALEMDLNNHKNSVANSNVFAYFDNTKQFTLTSIYDILSETIPSYILNLFCNVVETKMNSNKDLLIVKSNFQQLSNDLISKLFIMDQKKQELKCRLFRNPQCKIYFSNEIVWKFNTQQLNRLKRKRSRPGVYILGDKYTYTLPNNNEIEFQPDIFGSSTNWPKYSAFGITIISLPDGISTVDVYLSVQFDEIKYYLNGKRKVMNVNEYMGYKVFSNALLKNIETLTIRMAMKFESTIKFK